MKYHIILELKRTLSSWRSTISLSLRNWVSEKGRCLPRVTVPFFFYLLSVSLYHFLSFSVSLIHTHTHTHTLSYRPSSNTCWAMGLAKPQIAVIPDRVTVLALGCLSFSRQLSPWGLACVWAQWKGGLLIPSISLNAKILLIYLNIIERDRDNPWWIDLCYLISTTNFTLLCLKIFSHFPSALLCEGEKAGIITKSGEVLTPGYFWYPLSPL